MKGKSIRVLLALVLVLSFSLVTAVPASAGAVTLNVRPYTLYTGANGTSVWSTAQANTGSSSVLLTHTDNVGSVYVDFIPPAGETLGTFQADITGNTLDWSFWHFLQNLGSSTNGPQFELYFDDPTDSGWLEVTAVGLQNYTGTGAWVKETLAGATLAGYGGWGEAGSGASFFNWGPLTALSGIEAAVEAEGNVTEASDWVLTRVRVELWEDIDQYVYIDDIEIAGVTYYGMIQDAIDVADEGDDTIAVAAGTYVGNLLIDENLTIAGTGTPTINGDVHFAAATITITDVALGTGFEWYVDSDTAKIQSAIDAASTGDTINVAPGTYTETLAINEELTFVSTGTAAQTIIYNTSANMIDVTVANVTIDGFTIKGDATTTSQRGLYVRKGGFNFKNNIFTDIINDNIFVESAAGAITSGTIDNNILTDMGTSAAAYRAAILVETYSNNDISGVTISDNTISNYRGAETSGISLGETGSAAISAITVSGNNVSTTSFGFSIWNDAFHKLISLRDIGGSTLEPPFYLVNLRR